MIVSLLLLLNYYSNYVRNTVHSFLYYNRGDSMNDKDIRKILINYLMAERQDIRIYQEKSIGRSICDVMVVSSHLTGYEIKSDSDDYSRLDRQASA